MSSIYRKSGLYIDNRLFINHSVIPYSWYLLCLYRFGAGDGDVRILNSPFYFVCLYFSHHTTSVKYNRILSTNNFKVLNPFGQQFVTVEPYSLDSVFVSLFVCLLVTVVSFNLIYSIIKLIYFLFPSFMSFMQWRKNK